MQECYEDCGGGGGGGGGGAGPPPPVPQLSADILGYRRAVASPNYVDYRAQIANGTPPYYIYWFWRPCYKTYGANFEATYSCEQTFYPLGEGWGRDSIRLVFPLDVNYADVVVEVRDSNAGTYRTGADTLYVLGPAFFAGTPYPMVQCAFAPGDFYPFVAPKYDPATGTWVDTQYRVNYCTNQIEWGPAL